MEHYCEVLKVPHLCKSLCYQYEGTYGDHWLWTEKNMVVTINDKVLEGLLAIFLYVLKNAIDNVLDCIWTK